MSGSLHESCDSCERGGNLEQASVVDALRRGNEGIGVHSDARTWMPLIFTCSMPPTPSSRLLWGEQLGG